MFTNVRCIGRMYKSLKSHILSGVGVIWEVGGGEGFPLFLRGGGGEGGQDGPCQ